jgi:hypothetical protein
MILFGHEPEYTFLIFNQNSEINQARFEPLQGVADQGFITKPLLNYHI